MGDREKQSMSHKAHTETLKICQQAEERVKDSEEVIGPLEFPCNFSRIKIWLSCLQLMPRVAESSYQNKTWSGETLANTIQTEACTQILYHHFIIREYSLDVCVRKYSHRHLKIETQRTCHLSEVESAGVFFVIGGSRV